MGRILGEARQKECAKKFYKDKKKYLTELMKVYNELFVSGET